MGSCRQLKWKWEKFPAQPPLLLHLNLGQELHALLLPHWPRSGEGIYPDEGEEYRKRSQTCKPSSPLPVVGRQKQDRTQEEGSHSLGEGPKGSTAEGKQPPNPASSPMWPVPTAKQSCGLRATGRWLISVVTLTIPATKRRRTCADRWHLVAVLGITNTSSTQRAPEAQDKAPLPSKACRYVHLLRLFAPSGGQDWMSSDTQSFHERREPAGCQVRSLTHQFWSHTSACKGGWWTSHIREPSPVKYLGLTWADPCSNCLAIEEFCCPFIPPPPGGPVPYWTLGSGDKRCLTWTFRLVHFTAKPASSDTAQTKRPCRKPPKKSGHALHLWGSTARMTSSELKVSVTEDFYQLLYHRVKGGGLQPETCTGILDASLPWWQVPWWQVHPL